MRHEPTPARPQVAIFAYFKGSKKALDKLQDANALAGYTLCLANLALDGARGLLPCCSSYQID